MERGACGVSEMRIERGDIFYIGLNPYTTGCEQWSGRPGIIVSNDQNNLHSQTVEVVYCTTRHKPNLPTHTTILSTPYESTVLCEQVTTVDISRIGRCERSTAASGYRLGSRTGKRKTRTRTMRPRWGTGAGKMRKW